MTVRFEVLGIPTPQGSKSRMQNGALLEGRSTAQRQAHQSWRTAVAEAARAQAEVHGKLDGPLTLDVSFRFPMPASRSKAVRVIGWAWKTSAPDLDKLVRSVGDALKIGGLIADDSRFAGIHARKLEVASWTGAIVTVRPMHSWELAA